MEEEYLTRVVGNTMAREFHLYSNEGETKHVKCETLEEFMSVLDVCKDVCDGETLKFVDPMQPIIGRENL